MGKINVLTHSFNTGEKSIGGLARVDQQGTRLAAQIQENLYPHVVGKGQVRPGTTYILDTLSDAQAKYLKFAKSVSETALLELTPGNMRIIVNDTLLSRAAVTAAVTNGDFSSASGWTTGTTGGASANINSSVANALYLAGVNLGGLATCEQQVTTSNVGTERAMNITVARGPVQFRIGAIEGGQEYLPEVTLETGIYSLAFTPTGAAAGSDSFTKLLLHCDGSDESTTFTDSSSSAHTVTANGAADLDTGTKQFGSAAGQFDGSTSYLSLDGSSDFAFGTGDFTIEMWVNPASIAGVQWIYDSRPTGTNGYYPAIQINTGFVGIFLNGSLLLQAATPLAVGVFSHVAVTKASGVTRLFINGISQGSFTDTTNTYLNGASRPAIGVLGTTVAGQFFNGWLDEVRVSNGIARWTANFIVPAAAYSGSGNTFWIKFLNTNERAAIVSSCQTAAAGTMTLPGPWTAADIAGNAFNTDQSADIVFLANTSGAWQPRRILRYNSTSTSWGISLYKADDGPFTLANTANTRLKVGATNGNTTLTSEQSFFVPAHVGALFRLTHTQTNQTTGLSAEANFTLPIRIHGIATDNTQNYSYAITGTWSGTLTQQLSVISATDGFGDLSSVTSNGSASGAVGSNYNNITLWLRWGFKAGNYTSGAASVNLTSAGEGGSGVCRVTSYTSPTSVNVEVLSDFSDVSYTANWQEGEWSDNRGWPTAVQFFDGRLWWARKDQFWGSISNEYYSFTLDVNLNPDAAGDAGSIQRSIATGGQVNPCHWMLGLQRLIFGTDGAETSARSSSFDQPLTPTLTTLKDASTQGSSPVQAVKIDGRGIFIQRSATRAYELAFNPQAFDYVSTNLMRLNEDIGTNGAGGGATLTSLAVSRQPETYVWMLRSDGQIPILIYHPEEQVAGFIRHIAAPSLAGVAVIEDVVVLPSATAVEDRVYFSVRRTINGATVRFLEKLALRSEAIGLTAGNKMADAATFYAGPVTTCTGLAYLNGETVVAWGTTGGLSKYLGSYTVSGGQITLTTANCTNVTVGLQYTWRYQSAKLAYAAQEGTALLQPKRVGMVGLSLANFAPPAITYGPDFNTLAAMPSVEKGVTVDTTLVQTTYEEQAFTFNGGWDTDARVCLKGSSPYPATLLGLVIQMETSG